MQRGNGAVIGKQNTPTTSVATGVWALNEVQRAVLGGNWPASTIVDPYFENVSLLLHGNGTNGAQNNTFLDSSTNNFTITRNGNTTQGTFTPYGSNWSNYFNGSTDYLTAPDNAAWAFGTGDFTVESWIYFTAGSVYQRVLSQQNNSGTGWIFRLENNDKFAFYINGSAIVTSTTTLTKSQWYHVAVSRSGSSLKLFINGVNEATATNSTNMADISEVLAIGAFSISSGVPPVGEYFNGYISNARVVKGTAVYTSAFTPSTTPLTAITNTQLLTCQSNRFIDNSSNNFTITRTGDVSVQRFSPFNPTAAYSAATIGGSGYFDGTGDQLTVANNSAFDVGSGNFTVEAWVYLTSTSGSVFNYSNGQTQNSNFAWEIYQLSATSIQVFVAQGTSQYVASSTALVPNAWNHVAGVRNGNTLTIYVNGVAGGTTVSVAGVTVNNPSGATVKVSGYNNSTNNIAGYVTDARMVKGTAVYTANFTPPTAPLTAITNTSLLLSYTNAGIIDNAMMNDLETVGNAQISTTQSKFGGASLYLDGSGDYLVSAATNLPFTFGTGDFTIECWIYPASVSSGTITIVSNRFDAGADTVLIFAFGTTNGLFFHTQATAVINSATNLTANTWQHVALCRASGTVRIFLNGNQVGSSASSAQNLSATASVFVGQDGTKGAGAAAQFNGYIDDLRITKYARYTANFTAPTLPFPDQ